MCDRFKLPRHVGSRTPTSESVRMKCRNQKTGINYGKKVKEMKNGYKLQTYPIKLETNDFPSRLDEAEAFVNFFTENSLSSNLNPVVITLRREEEQT